MHRLTLIIALLALVPGLRAQVMEGTFSPGWELDSAARAGELRLDVGSTLFFRDNEFSSKSMDGYTLPGFRLIPRVGYRAADNIDIELGVYALRYWGADSYPNFAYRDIAVWKGHKTHAFHLLPWLRVQMATEGGVNFVLGNIHGHSAHRLIDPLFSPELNLTADPEAGAQVLWSGRWMDVDVWVNWESFIYRLDTHQEAFTAGFSGRVKYNSEDAPVHFYSPVQMLAQHRGGEIDTITVNSVQTLMNGAIGVGADISLHRRALRRLTLEADLLGYWQLAGELWPFEKGCAVWLHGALDINHARVKLGWFKGHDFISMFGYPFFGAVSTRFPGLTFRNPSTLYAGFEWGREFMPGYSVGVNVDIYAQGSTTGRYADGTTAAISSSTSFAAGIYMRINPSFILYRKHKTHTLK